MAKIEREEEEALERLLRKSKLKKESNKKEKAGKQENKEEEEKKKIEKEEEQEFGFSESFARVIDIPNPSLKQESAMPAAMNLEEAAGLETERRGERAGRNERTQEKRAAEEREETANYSLTTYEREEQSRDSIASISDMRRRGMFVNRTGFDSPLEKPVVEMLPASKAAGERMSEENLVKYVEERSDPWKTDDLIEKRKDLKKYRKSH